MDTIALLSLSVGVEITLEKEAIIPDTPFLELVVDFLGNKFVRATFLPNKEVYLCALEEDRII